MDFSFLHKKSHLALKNEDYEPVNKENNHKKEFGGLLTVGCSNYRKHFSVLLFVRSFINVLKELVNFQEEKTDLI